MAQSCQSCQIGECVMADFVYAELHQVIKRYLLKPKSDIDVATLILDSIISSGDLKNKVGEPINIEKHTASKLLNRKRNVPSEIRKAITREGMKDKIINYCAKEFLPFLDTDLLSKMILELTSLIDNDSNIPLELAKQLKTYAQTENIHLFLTDLILYVVKTDNMVKKSKVNETYKNKRLPVQETPEDVQKEEIPYLNAILDAYADKLQVPKVEKEELDKYEYTDNFNRHRKAYYNAEYVGRISRDAFADETPEPYEALKEEIESGVIDTWESDYKDGFERMSCVLTQATNTTTESTLLGRDTKWVSNDVKKGICHVLVNEKKLKGWVKK